jgi:RHS repeat-associated protein
VYEHSGIREDRIYLGGYEIYRRTVGTTLSLERQTLHVNDDTKRILLFETKTIDTEHPTGLPQIRSRWQLDNHLGSSSCELNDNAQVISYEEYHPFGSSSFHTVDSGAEVSAKRYRYTGKERDDETGLYYYGARYYASWLGRWTGCDPKVEDGWNLYVYVRNNPVLLVDPSGNESGRFQKNLSSAESAANNLYGKKLSELNEAEILKAAEDAGLSKGQASSILGHIGEEKTKDFFRKSGYTVLDGGKNVNTPGPDFIVIDEKGNVSIADNKESFSQRGSSGANSFRSKKSFKNWVDQTRKVIKESNLDDNVKKQALTNLVKGKYNKLVTTSGENVTHLTSKGKQGNVSGLTRTSKGVSKLNSFAGSFSNVLNIAYIAGFQNVSKKIEQGNYVLNEEYQEKANALMQIDSKIFSKTTSSFNFTLGMLSGIISFRSVEELIDYMKLEADIRMLQPTSI